jgi:surface polysaccharide O-acyltransferase-like enzyme
MAANTIDSATSFASSAKTRQWQWGFDVLRILAIVAIIFVHITEQWNVQGINIKGIDPFNWYVLNAYNSLWRWGVDIYVMISGALFLDPRKDQPINKLYSKNIMRMITIILFWGFAYAAIYHPINEISPQNLKAFTETWLLGHFHMWFLYMIVGLYAITPLLRCITASETMTKYFLILAFIANIAIPFITDFGHLSFIKNLFNQFRIQLPLGYSFFFVLGYWLHKRPKNKYRTNLAIISVIAGLLLTVILTEVASQIQGKHTGVFSASISLPMLLASAGIFSLIDQVKLNGPRSFKMRKNIKLLSRATLGVYLIHIMVLSVLNHVGINAFMFGNSLFAVPFTVIVAAIISFILSLILLKIPFFKKHFV